MKIKPSINWHCRKFGGLFLGFRCHFPTTLIDDNDHSKVWNNIHMNFGFLFFSLIINLDYNFRHETFH